MHRENENKSRNDAETATDPASAATENDNKRRHARLAERMYKMRYGLTLRFALLSVLTLFGLGLVIVVAISGADHLRQLQTYRLESQIEQTRRAIRSAYIEVQTAGRQLDFAALGRASPEDISAPVKRALDHIVTAKVLATDRGDQLTATRLAAQADRTAALFGQLGGLGDSAATERPVIDWQLSEIAIELSELRRGTLGSFEIADAQMAMLHWVRDQTIAEQRDIDTTTDFVFGMLVDPSSTSNDSGERLESALIRLQAPVLDLFTTDARIVLPTQAFQALSRTISQDLVPDLEQLIAEIAAEQVSEGTIARWQDHVLSADTEIRRTLAEADMIARDHIGDRIETARQDAVVAMTSGGIVLLVYVLSVVMIVRRLIAPMAQLRGTLMRLAQGDLRPIKASDSPFTDVQAVIDALRVFRIDAIRRERLRWERMELTAELTAANSKMRADLEAAAALQRAQFPSPATVGTMKFATYFEASTHLGGDSFDFFRLSDGRIVMFQIDIAGHGTASSLVAIAAHTTIKRALHEIEDSLPLAMILEEVNANWQDDLPYFTALLIAFDPSGQNGRMVQAGHPYPLLLRPDHLPESIGMGALPIGVHDTPGYEEQPVSLDTGDRLFVFSDGLYEVENTEGMIFGEDRLQNLLGELRALPTDALIERMIATIRAWAGTAELDDDISLVVMEKIA